MGNWAYSTVAVLLCIAFMWQSPRVHGLTRLEAAEFQNLLSVTRQKVEEARMAIANTRQFSLTRTFHLTPTCQVGQYSAGGSSCQHCPPGHFNTESGSTSCDPCPAGQFSSSPGSSSCERCPAGQFSAESGSTSCDSCPAGQYSPGPGSTNCARCAAGHISTSGSSACQPCPAGRYNTQGGMQICDSCAPGRYSSRPGSTTCGLCPAGQFSLRYGSTSCDVCAPGQYSSSPGSTACQSCPAGQYSSSAGSPACQSCPAGQYSSSAGSTSCQTCPAGHFSTTGSSSCQGCPAGQFKTRSGLSNCSPCPAGQYSSSTGSTSCSTCPAGQFSTSGSSSCQRCPAGQFSTSGSSACQRCPAGQYSSQPGSTSCSACPAGQYSPGPGSTNCARCAAGHFSTSGSSACQQCPAGRYSASHGSTSCQTCPAGQFSTSGSSSCQRCPAGQYSTQSGSSSCSTCPAGRYSSSAGSTSCQSCPAGQYSSSAGSISCRYCPAGQYSAQSGSSRCTSCQTGWTSTAGATSCTAPPAQTIRLVGGGSSNQGRVEVYHNGQWGTVCDDSFDLNDAHVACRQLGLGTALQARGNAAFGQGSGQIWMDNLACGGSEARLGDCRHNGWGSHNCGHSEDAGVVCSGASTGRDIRLAGGSSTQGRVEVLRNGQWGTVCDDSFDINDAHVACRQLGLGSATAARGYAAFGQGSGQIWLDNLNCGGSEARLGDCRHNGWGSHNCGHSEDAGVVCSGGASVVQRWRNDHRCGGSYTAGHGGTAECDPNSVSPCCSPYGWCGASYHHCYCSNGCIDYRTRSSTANTDIRLVGGRTSRQGRVEVLRNGQWGTVCDDNFDINDAHVACRQLGYGRAVQAQGYAAYGQGSGQIWLDNLHCGGSEARLGDCRHNGWGSHNCGHSEDAGVVCS